LPVGEHALQALEECGPVVRLGDMAEFMGDDIVDCVDGRLDESTIKK
jgi:hypothetical protein